MEVDGFREPGRDGKKKSDRPGVQRERRDGAGGPLGAANSRTS